MLLILSALGKGGEVITSRGELVEIGGSFRIPEIMVQCGCTLREVGATNKTHLRDYENAIGPETRALLKVHTSNFKIMGFSQSVPLDELVALGHEKGLPVIEDLGSGSLVDLEQFGIHDEPTVQQSVKAGWTSSPSAATSCWEDPRRASSWAGRSTSASSSATPWPGPCGWTR